MRALVTGGAGFIGSNLVDALVRRGDGVTVLDDMSTGRAENLSWALGAGAELVEGDIRDAGATARLFERLAPETVFHLAAQIDVRRATEQPALDARVNIEGTINVLEAARRAGVRRFINSSTGGAIYGNTPQQAPEDQRVAPESPYGQSKFAAEGYCDLYRRLHGLSTVSLRYANVYGPRQDPLGEGGVIAIFLGKLIAGERPTVFGDGLQTRDYVYVGEVVEANLAAAGSQATGPFNVGRGAQTTVLELVGLIGALGDGAPFEAEHAPERPGEVRHNAVDATRARAELGWRSQVDLSEGLRRTFVALRTPDGGEGAAAPARPGGVSASR